MKEIFFISIIFIFLILPCEASSNPQEQEVIRNYLRRQCATQKQKDITKLLKVDPSYLCKFISEPSPRSAPKIVKNFQEKFPEIYQQVIMAYLTQDIYYSQNVTSGYDQHVSRGDLATVKRTERTEMG